MLYDGHGITVADQIVRGPEPVPAFRIIVPRRTNKTKNKYAAIVVG